MNLLSYLQDGTNWPGPSGILTLLLQHLASTGAAVAIAAVVAIPLGILVGHTGRGFFLVVGLSHGARAIPSLGLLFLAVMLLGTGAANLVVVLALLALPSILTATAAGVRGADRQAVHAGRALGMTAGQVVTRVEVPLALPLMVRGLRSATLQVVATATVAAFASGGGLGRILVAGLASRNYPQMFGGALLVGGLAIVLYLVFGGIGVLVARRTRPRGTTARSLATVPS